MITMVNSHIYRYFVVKSVVLDRYNKFDLEHLSKMAKLRILKWRKCKKLDEPGKESQAHLILILIQTFLSAIYFFQF
jgi:hypothetical protein